MRHRCFSTTGRIPLPGKVLVSILAVSLVVAAHPAAGIKAGIVETVVSKASAIAPTVNTAEQLSQSPQQTPERATSEVQHIEVEALDLTKTSVKLTAGETASLLPIVSPADATDQSVVWSSSDSSVATINAKGVITAVSAGTAAVKITSNNHKTAVCSVTVNAGETADSSETGGTIVYSKFGAQEGTLSIPAVNISGEPVYHGDTEELLSKGIGQFTGGHYPGEGGKVILAAHNYLSFKNLKNIKTGDQVTFRLAYGTYVYRVYDIEISDEKDAKIVQPDDSHEYLELYTCYPFDSGSYHPQRFVVYAQLVQGTKVRIPD